MKGMYISQEFFLFKFHVLFISLMVVGLERKAKTVFLPFVLQW